MRALSSMNILLRKLLFIFPFYNGKRRKAWYLQNHFLPNVSFFSLLCLHLALSLSFTHSHVYTRRHIHTPSSKNIFTLPQLTPIHSLTQMPAHKNTRTSSHPYTHTRTFSLTPGACICIFHPSMDFLRSPRDPSSNHPKNINGISFSFSKEWRGCHKHNRNKFTQWISRQGCSAYRVS